MTKKLFSPLLIIFILMLSNCSHNKTPGEDVSGGGDTDGDKIIDDLTSWFTEEEFNKMAPLTLVGGHVDPYESADYPVEHIGCTCKHNVFCGASELFYTYDNFVKAIRNYPDMLIDPDTGKSVNHAIQKRILAAYFANVSQETNGQGNTGNPIAMLCFTGETAYDDSATPSFCGYNAAPNGYCYNGRGPLQLTWQVNYENFSQDYFGDDRAAQDPRILTEDPVASFASSFWFFANYVKDSNPWKKISKGISQFIIHPRNFNNRKRDFAYTIFLINGGYECGPTGGHSDASIHRINAFKYIYKNLTGRDFVDKDDKLECDDMIPDATDEAMTTAPYWES